METVANTPVTAETTPVAVVTPPTSVAPVAVENVEKPVRKSQKGKWGKVGAPPKPIKYPRGSYTIAQLVALNPQVCELTLRNTVTNAVRGFKMVNKQKVEIPVTIVRLPKNAVKETVGRPNYRFISKAAFDANQKNIKPRAVKPTAPAPAAVVAADVVA
jgi:hypothetical protein